MTASWRPLRGNFLYQFSKASGDYPSDEPPEMPAPPLIVQMSLQPHSLASCSPAELASLQQPRSDFDGRVILPIPLRRLVACPGFRLSAGGTPDDINLENVGHLRR